MVWLTILLLSSLCSLPIRAQSLSFSLASEPTQCEELSISWSGGTPPYEVTIIPMYYNGLNVTVWDWSVVDENTTDTTWSGTLAMPGGSFITVVLSDATGFGSGGTSDLLTVANSSDTSCQPTSEPSYRFSFALSPPDGLGQCDIVDFLIGGYNLTSDPEISAVVPGGPSIVLGTPDLAFWVKGVAGFYMNWTVDIPEATDVVFLAGDADGRATGGFLGTFAVGNSSETGCLTDSPFLVSTPSSSSSHTGAIVGGVIGGFIGLGLLIFIGMFFIRRRNIRARRRSTQEKVAGLRMYPLEGFNRDEAPREAFGSE